MKISDVIKELHDIQSKHGDLPIHTFDDVDFDYQIPNIEVVDPSIDTTCVENKGQLSIGSSLFVFIS